MPPANSKRPTAEIIDREEASPVLPMMVAMILLAVLSQFFRSSIGVIAPELAADLKLAPDQVGLLSSTFFLIFAALQIPVGILLDRYGARSVLTLMMSATVAGALAFATAQDAGDVTVARLLIGLGCAGLMVGSLSVLARWYPPDRFAAAMAVLFATANAGSLFATFPLAAACAIWGWRGTFIGLAVLSAALTALFFFVVRDAPPGHPFLRERKAAPLVDVAKGLREALRVPDLLYVLPMVAIGYASVITVLGLWGGPYLHDVYGLDAEARGRVLSAMAVAMILGTLAYGPLDNWLGARRPIVVAGSVATSGLLVLLGLMPQGPLWLTTSLLCLFAFVGAYSVTVMAHGVALFPERLVGRGVTLLNTALIGGTAALQAGSGEIILMFGGGAGDNAATAYSAVFLALAIVTLVCVALYCRARDTAPRKVRPATVQPVLVARSGKPVLVPQSASRSRQPE
jgi:MFS family permease